MVISNSRRPVRRPDESAVRAARAAYWTFCRPENKFEPEDVWGVLFWSRLQLSVDFVPPGQPSTGKVRERCIVDAVKFWLTHAHREMRHAGFAPRLEYPPDLILHHVLVRLDAWLQERFLPSFDLTNEAVRQDIHGRLPSVRRLWAWALQAARNAGLVSRQTLLDVGRRALISAGVQPESEDELVRILVGLRDELAPGSIETHFDPKTSQWTTGHRQLRDGSKTLRALRYEHRKQKEDRHLSLDAPIDHDDGDTHAAHLEDPASLGGIEAVIRGRNARASRRLTDLVRACVAHQQSVPVQRRDARTRAVVRKRLWDLWRGDITQKDLAGAEGLSSTRVSRIYRQEMAAVRAEIEARLSSRVDPPPEAQSEENSSPM